VGNVVGSDRLKTEGAAQEVKGDVQPSFEAFRKEFTARANERAADLAPIVKEL
jgi:uncharacterized protein YjbJ (UPF0337 family)